MIKLDKNTDSSEDIDKTITEWLETTTYEQRKAFIDGIFDLFYSTEANTFGEMSSNLSTNLPIVIKKYNEFSKEEKETMTEMLKKAVSLFLNNISEREKEKLSIVKEEYKAKGKQKIKEIERKIKSKKK